MVATEGKSEIKKFKPNDRVKRKNVVGCVGTVREIKTEISQTEATRDKDKREMVVINWDNGTISYLGPEAIISAE